MAEEDLVEHTQAKLFRAPGFPGQGQHAAKLVRKGSLRELLQEAIGNPDEVWRYSIVTPGRPLITAEQIRSLAAEWELGPR